MLSIRRALVVFYHSPRIPIYRYSHEKDTIKMFDGKQTRAQPTCGRAEKKDVPTISITVHVIVGVQLVSIHLVREPVNVTHSGFTSCNA